MTVYRELLYGCGHSRIRKMDPFVWKSPNTALCEGVSNEDRWQFVTTVDINPACEPHYVMDLDRGLQTLGKPMPRDLELFEQRESGFDSWRIRDSVFDEVHAYEVLEHLGDQGDTAAFFGDFDEIWRVLKPGGWLCASVPSRYSCWLWGDPGHRRAILPQTLQFLCRPAYDRQLGVTPMSDYRQLFAGDWDVVYSYDNEENHNFILQAVKPARPSA